MEAFKGEATGKESVFLLDIYMSAALLDYSHFNGIKSKRWDFYKDRKIFLMFLICYDKNEK